MDRSEYYQEVIEKLQKQYWDIEMNEAFNRMKIEELEHDLGKAETMILVPGVNMKTGRQAIGAMQQEKLARERKTESYAAEKERLQEQITFIREWTSQGDQQ